MLASTIIYGCWSGGVRQRFVVDVKAANKPLNLIVEVGKVKAETIYILARAIGLEGAQLLGWEWGRSLLQAPRRDFGYGVINHYIARGKPSID